MARFESSLGDVELTDERLLHILTFHPEVKLYVRRIGKVLENPDRIVPSRHDHEVNIFYGKVGPRKHLAVVVKFNHRSFILTVYITNRIPHSSHD